MLMEGELHRLCPVSKSRNMLNEVAIPFCAFNDRTDTHSRFDGWKFVLKLPPARACLGKKITHPEDNPQQALQIEAEI
jgi:hypothetical protein